MEPHGGRSLRPDICHTVSSSSYLQQAGRAPFNASNPYQPYTPGLSPAKTSCTPSTPATLMTPSPHLPGLDTNPHLSSNLSTSTNTNSKIVSQTLVTQNAEEVELRRLPPSVQHVVISQAHSIPLTVSNNGRYQKTFQRSAEPVKNTPHYPVPQRSNSTYGAKPSPTYSERLGAKPSPTYSEGLGAKPRPTYSEGLSPNDYSRQYPSPVKAAPSNGYSHKPEVQSYSEFEGRKEKKSCQSTADLISSRSLDTEPTASDIFPKFQSKRKHSHSSSSDEKDDNIVKNKKTFGGMRTYGSYGKASTTVFRSAFPSDESEEESVINYLKSGGVTDPPAPAAEKSPSPKSKSSSPEPQRCRLGQKVNWYMYNLSQDSTPPINTQNTDFVTAFTHSHTTNSSGFVLARTERPGRTAASKAQDLIKELNPTRRRKRSRTSSGESMNSASSGANDSNLRADIHPFMQPVDAALAETKDYYSVIEKPMCFQKIADNLTSLHYYSTTEIIGDLRQIFENCYKYNGTDSWISKMACKIEMAMEQKISTLPYSVREKCALTETSPHLTLYRNVCGRRVRTPRVFTLGSKSPIMLAMEELTLYKIKEVDIMKEQEGRRREEKLQNDTIKLAGILNSNSLIKQLNSSWEFISTCVMVCVCQEQLIMAFTLYELEIGLLYPEHSQYLAHLMVKLSSPTQQAKKLTQSEVHYTEWNVLVRAKIESWFSYVRKYSVPAACLRFGIQPEFFEMFGPWRSPMKTYSFHELSLSQRVTVLHTLCISKTETNPSLLHQFGTYDSDALRPTLLGQDGLSTQYMHFPLWPEEVRVYAVVQEQIECMASNVDELHQLIEQLKTKGQPVLHKITREATDSKPPKTKSLLKCPDLVALLHEMQCLYESLIVHQAHHIMVESEILKRTVPLLEKAECMEPVSPPATPPPPSHPPSPELDEEAGLNTEVEEDEKFCHSSLSTPMDSPVDSPAVDSPAAEMGEEMKEEVNKEIKEENGKEVKEEMDEESKD